MGIAGISCLALGLGLGLGLSANHEEGAETCKETKYGKCYKNGAVTTDDDRCATVGANILKKGGSAVDAAISTLICQGVVNNYHSGIGGGAFMVIYDKKTNQKKYINCREKAPLASDRDMFGNDPLSAQHGPLAMAVPGEVKCMHEAHKLFGFLDWSDLFQESINMARNGFEVYSYSAHAIEDKTKWLQMPEYGWSNYLNEDGSVKKEGEMMKDERLAVTLERIAADPDTFYTGDLADDIAEDLKQVNSIITKEDLEKFDATITEPLHSKGLT